MELNIVILAAGHGSRMLTNKPKILHTLGNKTLIEHVVNTAITLNPKNIFVIINNKFELKNIIKSDKIIWVEQTNPQGTGHALQVALPEILKKTKNSKVIVLNADVPLIRSSSLLEILELANTEQADLGLITTNLNYPNQLGRIIRDKNNVNQIIKIQETKHANPEELKIPEINTGVYIFDLKFLQDYLPQIPKNNITQEYYLTTLIELAAQTNKKIIYLKNHNYQEFTGINTQQELSQAERYYQLQLAQNLMAAGVNLKDPNRIDIRGELIINGKDISIDVNVVFIGQVTLGENTEILANSIIEDSVIGANTKIGPFARIRPGSKIGNDARIGNFVEIKKTIMGNNSKAGHLSYLGDSIIGNNVNIGAGTITCNYDGNNKYNTIIEDGVFIGSGTELIAPVNIGSNATIAAGTTVMQDAPANSLTLNPKKQIKHPTWQRQKQEEH